MSNVKTIDKKSIELGNGSTVYSEQEGTLLLLSDKSNEHNEPHKVVL